MSEICDLATSAQRYRSLTLRKGQAHLVSDLNNAYQTFDRVTLDTRLTFLQDPLVRDPSRIPALRSYYEPIVRLAVSIIENQGISFEKVGKGVWLPSMIFDFDQIFEKYVRLILRERIEKARPEYEVLDGNLGAPAGARKPLFDDEPTKHPAKPDAVVRHRETGLNPLLLEAKYKPEDDPSREDIEQVIAYGFSYRSPNVVLVHPKRKGGIPGLHNIGTIEGCTFYHYIIDLAAEDPGAEEGHFALAMLDLIPQVVGDQAPAIE